MGILDVKITIATESRWAKRNKRLKRLQSASKSIFIQKIIQPERRSQSNHQAYMDVELHNAAAANQDDVDGFIGALERVSAEKRLTLSDIVEQVSPLGNTLLHVAASHNNENIVRLLLYHFPSLLMRQNSNGDTALHLAARTVDNDLHATFTGYTVIGTLLRFRVDWRHPLEDTDAWIEKTMALPDEVKLLRVRNKKETQYCMKPW
ncbi:hypothetical protein Ancab_007833 [Ancistrocladus abbreviatus]